VTALFGGAFDPIHCGHLKIAEEVRKLGYRRVVIIPSGNPPHKPMRSSFEHRVAMCRLVWDDVSEVEQGSGRSYTYDTLQHFEQPRAFVIGADAFSEIETWYRWEEVLRMTEFIVISRPGHQYDIPSGARIRRLDSLALDVSSSDIREQLSRGEQPKELSPEVFRYVEQYGLYGWPRTI